MIRIFYVLLVCGVSIANSSGDQSSLEAWSLVYGLASRVSKDIRNGSSPPVSVCVQEMGELAAALTDGKRWATLVHDASGVPSTGLQWRGTFWLGSREQCITHNDASRQLSVVPRLRQQHPESKPPFRLTYLVIYAMHNSTVQQKIEWSREECVTIGLCLPASCSVEQLRPAIADYLSSSTLAAQKMYAMNLEVEEIRKTDPDDAYQQTYTFKIFKSVCLLIATLTFLGTVSDKWSDRELEVRQSGGSDDIRNDLNGNAVVTQQSHSHGNHEAKNADNYKKVLERRNSTTRSIDGSGRWIRMLNCFSLPRNFKKIMDTTEESGVLLPINGWRVLNMFYVVFLHQFLYDNDRNSAIVRYHYLNKDQPNYFQHVIINSHVVVDSFFCLSGFLMARSFLKSTDIKYGKSKPPIRQNALEWLRAIGKRFLRLTPPYIFTILTASVMYSILQPTSVVRLSENIYHYCSTDWWRNLLYINNLSTSMYDKCLSWSYYLSNDMQFFIVGTLLLRLAVYHLKTAAVAGMLLLVLSVVINAAAVYALDYYPFMHSISSTMDTFYTPSYMRIGPYLIGLFGAYVLRYHSTTLSNKLFRYIGWPVVLLGGFYTMFGSLHAESMSLADSALYTATSRQLWSLLTIWFFLMLVTDNIWSPLHKFLSFRVWTPLSKLCYCVYLVNPVIIYNGILKSEREKHHDEDAQLMVGLGLIIFSFYVSFWMVLFIETPVNNVINSWSASKSGTRDSADKKPAEGTFSRTQYKSE